MSEGPLSFSRSSPVEELAAVVERGNEVDVSLVFKRVRERHDVRMLQLAQNLDLVL